MPKSKVGKSKVSIGVISIFSVAVVITAWLLFFRTNAPFSIYGDASINEVGSRTTGTAVIAENPDQSCYCPPGAMCKLASYCNGIASPSPTLNPRPTPSIPARNSPSPSPYPSLKPSALPSPSPSLKPSPASCSNAISIFVVENSCSASGYLNFTVVCENGYKQEIADGTCHDALSTYNYAKELCSTKCVTGVIKN